MERFKAEPPSKEMKVKLLQEIAVEYSIKWDAKSLEQRLYTPPADEAPQKTKTKQNTPGKTMENRHGLSFHGRKDSLDSKSMSRRSEDDSMGTSESCVSGPDEEEEKEDDPENKPFYYRFIMPTSYNNKPKIEKQESLPEKMTKSDLLLDDTGE